VISAVVNLQEGISKAADRKVATFSKRAGTCLFPPFLLRVLRPQLVSSNRKPYPLPFPSNPRSGEPPVLFFSLGFNILRKGRFSSARFFLPRFFSSLDSSGTSPPSDRLGLPFVKKRMLTPDSGIFLLIPLTLLPLSKPLTNSRPPPLPLTS